MSNIAQETDGWNLLILCDDENRSKTYLQNYIMKVLPFHSDLVTPSFHYISASLTLEPPIVQSNQGFSTTLFKFKIFLNFLYLQNI